MFIKKVKEIVVDFLHFSLSVMFPISNMAGYLFGKGE